MTNSVLLGVVLILSIIILAPIAFIVIRAIILNIIEYMEWRKEKEEEDE